MKRIQATNDDLGDLGIQTMVMTDISIGPWLERTGTESGDDRSANRRFFEDNPIRGIGSPPGFERTDEVERWFQVQNRVQWNRWNTHASCRMLQAMNYQGNQPT